MTISKYRISGGGDFRDALHVELTVDEEKFTTELATELNQFWSDAEYRLSATDGDVRMAMVRYVALFMMDVGLRGYNEHGINSEIAEAEGFCGVAGIITCTLFENDLSLDVDNVDVEKLA